MHRVVVSRRLYPQLLEQLKNDFEVVDNQPDVEWTPDQLAALLADADAALVTSHDRIDAALLERCPRLKIVANIAVGYNNIDLAACTRLGILATNTPDVLTEATADHAWALLLAAGRRVGESERWLRSGEWKRWTFEMFNGADYASTTLGIVGMGRIGRAVARRASGFSMRVIYHNRSRLAPELEGGAEYVDLPQLLQRADHLVLVVPYSAEVHHLIGRDELEQMKPSAVLVNIARGGVVDDAALVDALRRRTIAAAGLDVFENEPALNPGLFELENVVMTPHIASSTRVARNGMANLAFDNVREALAGRRPPSLLNPEALTTRRR